MRSAWEIGPSMKTSQDQRPMLAAAACQMVVPGSDCCTPSKWEWQCLSAFEVGDEAELPSNPPDRSPREPLRPPPLDDGSQVPRAIIPFTLALAVR
jgi:hypothetical protein